MKCFGDEEMFYLISLQQGYLKTKEKKWSDYFLFFMVFFNCIIIYIHNTF